jgi:hypothetical protein
MHPGCLRVHHGPHGRSAVARPTTRTTTSGRAGARATTARRCTATPGTRACGCPTELTRALFGHHRGIRSRHTWKSSTTALPRVAASLRTRCSSPPAICTRTRGTRPAHSLRRGERVVARAWGTGTPGRWPRSTWKSTRGTRTRPRRDSRTLADPSGGRGGTWRAWHAWAWNRRWLCRSRRLSCRRCWRRRSRCRGCRRCRSCRCRSCWCGSCWRGGRGRRRRLGGHLDRSWWGCDPLTVGRRRLSGRGSLSGCRLLCCCLLDRRRLASQLLLETSLDRRLYG